MFPLLHVASFVALAHMTVRRTGLGKGGAQFPDLPEFPRHVSPDLPPTLLQFFEIDHPPSGLAAFLTAVDRRTTARCERMDRSDRQDPTPIAISPRPTCARDSMVGRIRLQHVRS